MKSYKKHNNMKVTLQELKSLIREAIKDSAKLYSISFDVDEEDKDKIKAKLTKMGLAVTRISRLSSGVTTVTVKGNEKQVKAAIRWSFHGESGHLSVGEYFKKYAK